MSLEFNGALDALLDEEESSSFCSRCGMKIEDIFELSSGLCWICEKQPQPLEEQPCNENEN